ncbi:MAG: DMT family transporter [Treponema sp.]|jgi:drug/metabolite transporter (DMT)-like permease|nr:DMT family transporter [Treponema sp.]
MNKRVFGADLLLLVTAAVWGFGFVAQRSGMQYVGPFAFNGIRFILGSLSLLPLVVWRNRGQPKTDLSAQRKTLFFSSFLAGSCLFAGVTLQQLGMIATTAGNAGFITGLYVIFTPLFGIFLGRKTGLPTWIGAVLNLFGLFFLSYSGSLKGVNPGDLVIVVSAVFWAFHVLIIDRLVQKNDPIALSSGQFAFVGLYALAAAFLVEPPLSAWLERSSGEIISSGYIYWKSFPVLLNDLASGALGVSFISSAMIPILYGGLVSVGVGYTLQTAAQRYAPPAHATIILCLEGSFAALGGVLILREPVEPRIVLGFAMMLAGMFVSQWGLVRGRGI